MSASLPLGDLYHVGIVVGDLDDAMRRYQSDLGVGPWAAMGGEFEASFRGRPARIEARAAFARSGPIYLELVQPVTGEWTGSVFLAERGEGAYHLGYWVEDLEESLERARSAGYTVDLLARLEGGGGFAYLDAARSGGVHIELVSTAMRPMLESWLSLLSESDSPRPR